MGFGTMEVMSDLGKSSLSSVVQDKVKLEWVGNRIGRKEIFSICYKGAVAKREKSQGKIFLKLGQ